METDVTQIVDVAQAISNFGFMAVAAGVFLVVAAGIMFFVFKWFRTMITNTMTTTSSNLTQLTAVVTQQSEILQDLSEGLRTETEMRIRNLANFAFDLAIEQVLHLIKRVRRENHIANHETTQEKIRKSLYAIHNDRKTRFNPFTYHGKPLSDYCNDDWVEQVAKVVESEIYNEDGANNERAYTNVKLAYDTIKTEFFQNIKG